jgi:hypothetical protein
VPPPATTALGGVRTHLARETDRFQPSNITWACIPPPPDGKLRKRERYQAMADRALSDLDRWLDTAPLARGPARLSAGGAAAPAGVAGPSGSRSSSPSV